MAIELNPQTVKFYEKKGLQFFREFTAQDKFKKPFRIGFEDEPDTFSVICAKDKADKLLGTCGITIDKQNSIMTCPELLVDDEGKNIGQVLTLSSIMEFAKNKLNNFKLFSLKEVLPFYSKYGFTIENNDPYFILDGLKQVMKTKAPSSAEFQRDAKFYYNKVQHYDITGEENPELFGRACRVISEFMKNLSRSGMKKYMPEMENGTQVKFTDYDLLTNKDYLNKLLAQHKIDYRF
jgi:hypothetical protein